MEGQRTSCRVRAVLVLLLCSLLLKTVAAGAAADSASGRGHDSVRRLLHGGTDHVEHDATADPATPINYHSARLVGNKLGALAVFFAVPFIGCFVPFFIPIPYEIMKYGLLFAAGLFFTLALEHLTSDSASGFGDLTTSGYPYPFLLVVAGYMFTWFTDLVVHAIWDRKSEQQQQQQQEELYKSAKQPSTQGLINGQERLDCCKAPSNGEAYDAEAGRPRCSGANCGCNGNNCRCATAGLGFSEHEEVARAGGAVESAVAGHDHGHSHAVNPIGVSVLGLSDLLLLVLALCFHAVFEGLAIGLTGTVYSVWNTTLTIVLHKFFEGAALGATLKEQNRRRPWWSFTLYAAGFSITAPVGIAIGIILDSEIEPRSAQWVEAVGNGFAAGVFIFVAVSHLMVKGFRPGPKDRWWTVFIKWGATFLGAVTMSLLELRQS